MNYRIASAIGLAIVGGTAPAQNWLTNPGFESWQQNDDQTYYYSYTGDALGTASTGAYPWAFFNFAGGTSTSIRATPPAGLANAGNYSDYLTISAAGSGIGQVTEQTINGFDVPVTYNFVSGWVYITQGSVGLGWFDQATQQDNVVVSTSTLNQWVYLSDYLPAVQSSGFLIVGLSANSEFYADNMDAEPTPEPACFAFLGLGALGLLARRRRRAVA